MALDSLGCSTYAVSTFLIMAKDPAFLFYSADFLVGTLTMSEQEIGQYAFLLCVMHQKGRLSEEKMNSALKSGKVLPSVLEKFKKDENGCYYNERLEMESNKRSKFTASRRSNAKAYAQASAEHMPKHMENANENEDVNEISISESTPREDSMKFFDMINQNSAEYFHFLVEFAKRTNLDENIAGREVKKFADYWCERTGNGKKMRWETEKTFEIQRRLSKWFGNASQWSKEKQLSKTKQFII